MICPGCSLAAAQAKARDEHHHAPARCSWKSGCDCKHGKQPLVPEPRCVKCGGDEDLMDRAMAPGMTYCKPCRERMTQGVR